MFTFVALTATIIPVHPVTAAERRLDLSALTTSVHTEPGSIFFAPARSTSRLDTVRVHVPKSCWGGGAASAAETATSATPRTSNTLTRACRRSCPDRRHGR